MDLELLRVSLRGFQVRFAEVRKHSLGVVGTIPWAQVLERRRGEGELSRICMHVHTQDQVLKQPKSSRTLP